MTSIDKAYLTQQLRRSEPSSAFAAHLEPDTRRRMDRDALEHAVTSFEALGGGLGEREQQVLQRVFGLIGGQRFDGFATPPTALRELLGAAVSGAAKRLQVPPFSSHTAPRVVDPRAKATQQEPWKLELDAAVHGLPALSRDGQTLFVCDEEGSLQALAAEDGSARWLAFIGTSYTSPALSPDGNTLYAVGGDGDEKICLHALDAATGEVEWSRPVWSAGKSVYYSMSSPVLAPDGSRAFVLGADGFLYGFDTADGRQVFRKELDLGGGASYSSAVVSPDGRRIFCADTRAGLFCHDAETGERLWEASRARPHQSSPTVSPDGTRVVTVGDSQLHVFDAQTGEPVWTRKLAYAYENETPVFSEDGQRIIVPSGQGKVSVFEAAEGEPLATVLATNTLNAQLRGAPVLVAGTNDVVVADSAGRFYRLNLDTEESRRLDSTNGGMLYGAFALSPDGRFAYHGSPQSFWLTATGPFEP